VEKHGGNSSTTSPHLLRQLLALICLSLTAKHTIRNQKFDSFFVAPNHDRVQIGLLRLRFHHGAMQKIERVYTRVLTEGQS
jgi:hypothetical protein